MKKLSIYAVPVILLCMVFYSCTTDPLIPPEEPPIGFDSARYEWTMDTLFMDIKDIGGIDTSQVCLLTPSSLMVLNGEKFSHYPIPVSNLNPGYIGAVRKNFIYFGGNYILGTKGRPALFKWDGSSISEVDLNINDSIAHALQALGKLYVFSENEIWMGGNDRGALLFDGVNSTYYGIDSGYGIAPFFKVNGETYCVGKSFYVDSSATYLESYMNVYRLEGNEWAIAYSDTLRTGSSHYYPGPFLNLIGNRMIARAFHDLFEFNGTDFTTILHSNEIYFGLDICGQSLSNFMVFGGAIPGPEEDIYHWNGKKWSKELDRSDMPPFPFFDNRFTSIGEHYYLLIQKYSQPFLFYKFKPKE